MLTESLYKNIMTDAKQLVLFNTLVCKATFQREEFHLVERLHLYFTHTRNYTSLHLPITLVNAHVNCFREQNYP